MTGTLTELVASYGLLALFVLMTIDSSGIPLPSEVIMPAAGALAAAGHLHLAAVVAAGTIACLCGALIAYGVAARWGTQVLLGPGRWVGFRPRHLELADRWFASYGRWAVLGGRVVPVVRGYISFPAGLTRFPLLLFGVLTLSGSLPWCAGLAIAGYFLGHHYERVSGPLGVAAIVIAVVVVAGLIAWIVRERRGADDRR
ncbi:MAG: DedA family protein [Candidatus Dormibacteraeota bacterium]|nr:DedA family protein [Candidatus Dormibacteraeota bacterium]MBO0762209.1 DedA family protein [Candidatus Dormibacteraeota bacterium]